MKYNFFLVNTIIFLFLISSPNLISPMEEEEMIEEEIPAEEEKKVAIQTPRSLVELAANQVAKKAAEIYDSGGYEPFENYLNTVFRGEFQLPAEVKIELVFCELINELNRSDIFIKRIKEIYQKSEEAAFKYFSDLCQDGQVTILETFLEEDTIDKELVKYFISNLTQVATIGEVKGLIVELDAIEGQKEENKEFYAELLGILKNKTLSLFKNVQKKVGEVALPDENLKRVKELFDILDIRWTSQDPDVEESLRNSIERFKRLDNQQDQREILQYILTEYAPLSKDNFRKAVYLLRRYIVNVPYEDFTIDTLNVLDEQELENTINVYFEILNKVDEIFPEAKKLSDLPGAEDSLIINIFNILRDDIETIVNVLSSRLIKDSKFQNALDLLTKTKEKIWKFTVREEKGPADSILLSFYNLLDFFPQDKTDAKNFSKNLYTLLKKSIPTIKLQFQNLVPDIEREEGKIDWIDDLSQWLKHYIDEASKKGLMTVEEIEKLKEEFKTEVLDKFEAQ